MILQCRLALSLCLVVGCALAPPATEPLQGAATPSTADAVETQATPISSAPAAPARNRVTQRRTLAWGIVGWTLDVPEDDEAKTVSLAAASELHSKCPTTREQDWRFDGFDGDWLYFACLRAVPNPIPKRRPWGTYVSEAWIRTERSDAAERKLGVDSSIAPFETPKHGILVGMSVSQVEEIHGPPRSRRELGPMGAFDAEYDAFMIRYIDGRVASVE